MKKKLSAQEKTTGGFDARNRAANLETLSGEELDLLVIGGGITGAGILRDAALRGMRVALVEKNDFAWGTSSRSSKLIHGGLRYLETLDFKLVFEAQSERRILRSIAPHLVTPIPFLFPVFSESKFELYKIRAGLLLYDFLALFRNHRAHTPLTAGDIASLEPAVNGAGILGGVLYYDSFTDDIRLTVESVKSGVRAGGSALNRVEVTGFERGEGRISAVRATDVETGRRFKIRARYIIGACGPWSDGLISRGSAKKRPLLRPTKGSHLILPRRRIRNRNTVVMPSLDGKGRILFCIPWGDTVIAGTTDTDFDGPVDEVSVSRADAEYILEHVNHFFPGAALEGRDIISGYSGLRPLLNQEGIPESQVSREHRIIDIAGNMSIIAGGKLTTYRKMASEILDHSLARLHDSDRFRLSSTRNLSLVEKRAASKDASAGEVDYVPPEGLDDAVIDYLDETYGPGRDRVLASAGGDESLLQRFLPELPVLKTQLVHAVKEESCSHLDDFFLRRTSAFLKDRNLGAGAAEGAAIIMGALLGWSAARRKAEIERFREQCEYNLAAINELRK